MSKNGIFIALGGSGIKSLARLKVKMYAEIQINLCLRGRTAFFLEIQDREV